MQGENQRYAFVEDIRGIKLSPMKEEKAWYKVRHGKAKIKSLKPLCVELQYEVDNTDASIFHLGLDVGETTGVGVIQECKKHNKVVFKGVLRHRKDISKLVEKRAGYRRLRRVEKRYRPARFDNRGSSKKQGRLAPSIKARQDEILRLVRFLLKKLDILRVVVEDVSFDIRALTDGYKPYSWEYQRSNRLDENIRKATLMRDNFTCQLCKAKNTRLEVHHITPKRQNGEDTIRNLITLCSDCHSKITGKEDIYKDRFYCLTKGKQLGLRYASHVMQGKTYLYIELSKLITKVEKTDGGTTANKRIDWGIEKSHSNDALVITGLNPITPLVYEWAIKPLRKKRKCKLDKSLGIVQGDRVWYTPRGKKKVECYVNAILQSGKMEGYYKLVSVLDSSKKYGPVKLSSLLKINTDLGLRIS